MVEETGVPFDVTDEIEVGDMSEVKEDRRVYPQANQVLFVIQQASIRPSKDGSIKSLNIQAAFREGIDVAEKDDAGQFTGNTVKKYVNAITFIDMPVWVDTAVRTSDWWTKKNQPWKVPFKQLIEALGYEAKNPPKINDGWLSELIGREFRVNIILEEESIKDEETGKYVKTGEYRNRYKGFKTA